MRTIQALQHHHAAADLDFVDQQRAFGIAGAALGTRQIERRRSRPAVLLSSWPRLLRP